MGMDSSKVPRRYACTEGGGALLVKGDESSSQQSRSAEPRPLRRSEGIGLSACYATGLDIRGFRAMAAEGASRGIGRGGVCFLRADEEGGYGVFGKEGGARGGG